MPDVFVEEKKVHPYKSMFPLAEFAIDPKGVHFATQAENEEVHLFLRMHFVTNIRWIGFSLILLILPLVVAPFFELLFPFSLSAGWSLILTLFYYIIIFGFVIFSKFLNWYFNVYIVTNERVVDVDFINIIYREVSSTRLNLVQDITVKTGGVFKAIFDFGNVFIQTAGTEVNFEFHAVPHPQEVAREIEKLMEEARKKEGSSDLEQELKK